MEETAGAASWPRHTSVQWFLDWNGWTITWITCLKQPIEATAERSELITNMGPLEGRVLTEHYTPRWISATSKQLENVWTTGGTFSVCFFSTLEKDNLRHGPEEGLCWTRSGLKFNPPYLFILVTECLKPWDTHSVSLGCPWAGPGSLC